MPEPFLIERTSHLYTRDPFILSAYVECHESVRVEDEPLEIHYVVGLVPLDCIDDVHRANVYNPRHPRGTHRDDLMDQVGTYGLIQPLVGTLDAKGPTRRPQQLYLIDGRHRYHALLELDQALKADIRRMALEAMHQDHDEQSISDITRLKSPRQRSIEIMSHYKPKREKIDGSDASPLIPMKIYLGQDDVERIGMAVFLNKGQKKLAGGEEIEKIFRALSEALEQEKEGGEATEAAAVRRVAKGQGADVTLVVLSQHVTAVMNDPDSPWFEIIGRYQGELASDGDRRKPLTAKNFLNFVDKIVDAEPLNSLGRRRRDLEVARLNRLGNIFYAEFRWPEDLPSKSNRYTATSLLCRSFVIETVGMVLNEKFAEEKTKLFSAKEDPSDEVWKSLSVCVRQLHDALKDQAGIRAEFETKKDALEGRRSDKSDAPKGAQREALLLDIDRLRGKLWSLDTIIPSLKIRLQSIMMGVAH
jgi:hypothetical protein